MANNEFKLADGAAQIFEVQKFPSVFGPFAIATTEIDPKHRNLHRVKSGHPNSEP